MREDRQVASRATSCTWPLTEPLALDIPFLLLPFRPSSDPNGARTFIRNYFSASNRDQLRGSSLASEMRMTDVMVGAPVTRTRVETDDVA